MLERVMPVLARPVKDKEATLAAELLEYLMQKDGLHDEEAEVAFAVAMAMYCEHRRLMKDIAAPRRIFDNINEIMRSGQFRMRTGEDFVRMVRHQLAEDANG